MSSPASTPSRRRGKRGRGSNPPTRKCFEGAGGCGVGSGGGGRSQPVASRQRGGVTDERTLPSAPGVFCRPPCLHLGPSPAAARRFKRRLRLLFWQRKMLGLLRRRSAGQTTPPPPGTCSPCPPPRPPAPRAPAPPTLSSPAPRSSATPVTEGGRRGREAPRWPGAGRGRGSGGRGLY